MATRCFCPPERFFTGSSSLSASPTSRRIAAACSDRSRPNAPSREAARDMSGRQAFSTFWMADRFSTRQKSW